MGHAKLAAELIVKQHLEQCISSAGILAHHVDGKIQRVAGNFASKSPAESACQAPGALGRQDETHVFCKGALSRGSRLCLHAALRVETGEHAVRMKTLLYQKTRLQAFPPKTTLCQHASPGTSITPHFYQLCGAQHQAEDKARGSRGQGHCPNRREAHWLRLQG